ncbi:uncharacterized protein DNG_03612 [Cephalotrichum gorgonifer]|uniref:Uncharacterized protein n=1 Tax=Cephalotrichum gorgonifer TaxID=2041049 RepID=A0AAE8MUK2_9PEZI|nr:uncharacterized protein DNG_03612 [Cephalotrichum gorgonifer]
MKVSLWKSAAGTGRQKTGQSVRGRISNPIPIPNPADKAFSVLDPGPAVTASYGSDDRDHPAPQRPPPSQPRYQSAASSSSLPHNGSSPILEHVSEGSHGKGNGSNNSLPTSTAPASHPAPSPGSGSARNLSGRTTNQPAHIRHSAITASSQRTGNTNASNNDFPQRKKSTIRGALSKLFGRRRKGGSQASSTGPGASLDTSIQHRSDLSSLGRIGKDGEPKRSASLPITEYDRALRSHSIGPQDITAIESTHTSFQADFSFTRRRAATASSQLYLPIRARDSELAGLSPRPASTHARSGGALGDTDPNEIGRAITSDLAALRRRSRSLSGLEDIGGARNGGVRRRSDEIRYWRDSYGTGLISPLSSNIPEGDDERGAVVVDPPGERSSAERSRSPPEPFHFGSLATMNEMAGMKITQAASLETRTADLEARMRHIEGVVTRLCNAVPGFGAQAFGREPVQPPTVSNTTLAYAGSAGAPDPSLYRTESQDGGASVTYSSSRPSEEARSSFGEVPTLVGSLHPPPGARHPAARRPISNSTIRGAASLPALSKEANGALTVDHYTTLLALIETERSTRRVLEAQIRKLSHTVHVLTKQAGANLQLEPPPTARSFGGQSAFDEDTTDDDDDESEGGTAKRRSPKLEDSGIGAGLEDTDDENMSDTFAGPQEERTFGFGAFGEELRDDDEDGNRKKAARTLSLSQLTAGNR